MDTTGFLIPILTFAAVSAAAAAGLLALLGGGRDQRLVARLRSMEQTHAAPAGRSLLRTHYLEGLNPLERRLEALPVIDPVVRLLGQAGRSGPAYPWLLISLGLAVAGALAVFWFTGRPLPALLGFVGAGAVPWLYLKRIQRQRRMQFDEQLPGALDIISRALRAGSPFGDALRVVAEEMDDPIATEFGLTFADINYGLSVKAALAGTLERTPDIGMAVVVTAVLVQRETGGNLAEVLDKAAAVVRARHRFRRRLRTLTAEGRVSARVLIATPFALAAGLMVTSPDYLPMLFEDPWGPKLLTGAIALMCVGIVWIRRITQLEM